MNPTPSLVAAALAGAPARKPFPFQRAAAPKKPAAAAPVGKADSPAASAALAEAKRSIGQFLASEQDPRDRAKAQQALTILGQIAS